MGRPTIRNFPNNSFCSGPQVQANDAAIMAELQGNCAKNVNIKQYKTTHSIAASVRWLWLETSIGPVGDPSSPVTTEALRNGIIWQYRCERPCTLSKYLLQFTEVFQPGGNGITVKIALFKSKEAPKFDDNNAPTDFYSIGEKLTTGNTFDFYADSQDNIQSSANTPLYELGSPNASISKGEYLFVAAQVVWPEDITNEVQAFQQLNVPYRQRLHVQVMLQEEHL
tara:strand:+ start:91 stop:765 length:675 start_codon:yes stop_codon:yes gene_type:complete